MNWESYEREISEAKDEYYNSIKPLLAALEEEKEKFWKKYVARISRADSIFSKGES